MYFVVCSAYLVAFVAEFVVLPVYLGFEVVVF